MLKCYCYIIVGILLDLYFNIHNIHMYYFIQKKCKHKIVSNDMVKFDRSV